MTAPETALTPDPQDDEPLSGTYEIEDAPVTPEEPETPAAPAPDAEKEALKRTIAAFEQAAEIQKTMAQRAQPAPMPAPVYQPPPQPQGQVLTREQWNQWYLENPYDANLYMADQVAKARADNVNTRVDTYLDAASMMAKNAAASKYADVFADYKDDIEAVAKKLTPENLSKPDTWDDIVRYVKGQNVDKIVAKAIADSEKKALEAAQALQRSSAGFSGGSRGSGSAVAAPSQSSDSTFGLDTEHQRAAKAFGIPFKEYAAQMKEMRGKR